MAVTTSLEAMGTTKDMAEPEDMETRIILGMEDTGSRAGGTRLMATRATQSTAKATTRAMAMETTASSQATARDMDTQSKGTQDTQTIMVTEHGSTPSTVCLPLVALHSLAAEHLQDQQLSLPALAHL